jgi:5-methylcytosine-specific restriction endonuclease McrA
LASTKLLETIKRKRQEKFNREHQLINGIDHKLCNKHHIFFPEESPWVIATEEYFYHNNKNKTDYLHPECKRCSILKAREWAKENPEKEKELRHKINTNPSEKTRETKRIDAQTRRDNGKYYEWLKNNPDKQKEYIKNHREHDITEKEWNSCLKIFEYRCAYCGLPQEKHIVKRNGKYIIMNFHKEHADNEGYNDLRNAVPACRSCNNKKWAFPMEEWYREQDFFSEEKLQFIIWWTTEGYKDYIEDKPPYRIVRKKNEGLTTYHWELWSVDEKRNMVECIDVKDKKGELDTTLIP